MITLDLTGKRAIVTGAGRGLGKCIALRLAEAGAQVFLADINGAQAEQAAEEGKAKGFLCAARGGVNVGDYAQMGDLVGEIAAGGGLDIMVNVAGIMYTKKFMEVEPEGLKKLMDVNICGVTYGTKFALEKMMPKGTGRIVNISSIAGRQGGMNRSYYAMTKAAVINLTQSAAATAAKSGVTVNSVCPGIIRTPMWEQILDDMQARTGGEREALWQMKLDEQIPMGVAQEEMDIANAVLFLCSDLARYITGQAINVDGGARMN